jgi:DNA-binding transcriptional ArsR family regulator
MKHDNDISAWNHQAYEAMLLKLRNVYKFWHGKWITPLHIAVHFKTTKETAMRWLNLLADAGMMTKQKNGCWKYRAIKSIDADLDDYL